MTRHPVIHHESDVVSLGLLLGLIAVVVLQTIVAAAIAASGKWFLLLGIVPTVSAVSLVVGLTIGKRLS